MHRPSSQYVAFCIGFVIAGVVAMAASSVTHLLGGTDDVAIAVGLASAAMTYVTWDRWHQ